VHNQKTPWTWCPVCSNPDYGVREALHWRWTNKTASFIYKGQHLVARCHTELTQNFTHARNFKRITIRITWSHQLLACRTHGDMRDIHLHLFSKVTSILLLLQLFISIQATEEITGDKKKSAYYVGFCCLFRNLALPHFLQIFHENILIYQLSV
jgi:hypothetical protein